MNIETQQNTVSPQRNRMSVGKLVFKVLVAAFGLIGLCGIVYDQFEDNWSLWELSLAEFLYWVLFIGVSWRHYHWCKIADISILETIYRPLRNIAILGVLYLGTIILVSILSESDPKAFIDSSVGTKQNLIQFVDFCLTLLCIWLATPKSPTEPTTLTIAEAETAGKSNEGQSS